MRGATTCTQDSKAEIDAKTAAIEAQTTRVLGQAKAQSVKLAKVAKAERLQLLVGFSSGVRRVDVTIAGPHTVVPEAASATAVPRPMPRLAPVTRITRSDISPICVDPPRESC